MYVFNTCSCVKNSCPKTGEVIFKESRKAKTLIRLCLFDADQEIPPVSAASSRTRFQIPPYANLSVNTCNLLSSVVLPPNVSFQARSRFLELGGK